MEALTRPHGAARLARRLGRLVAVLVLLAVPVLGGLFLVVLLLGAHRQMRRGTGDSIRGEPRVPLLGGCPSATAGEPSVRSCGPMTRILTLTNLYPPHAYGGYEMSCDDVMRRLAGRGHEVTVLTTTTRVAGVADPPGDDTRVRRELEWYWQDHELRSPHPARRLAM